MIDGELHELRETIIRGGHRTLGITGAIIAALKCLKVSIRAGGELNM